MLSRVPAGELMDSPRRAPVRRTAEVLYSDTSWRPCLIVAWARYRGGWAALIRWPDGREDWRQFDRRHMRPQGPALRILLLGLLLGCAHLRVSRDPGGDPVADYLAAGRVLGWRIGQDR
jgi:hypothetical protein